MQESSLYESTEKEGITFECSTCGYIHSTQSGRPPAQCIECGGRDFEPVDPTKTNRSELSTRTSWWSLFMESFRAAKWRVKIMYFVLLFILIVSLGGVFYEVFL